jgi:hypothetical protein
MAEYLITFADFSVTVRYGVSNKKILPFLNLLFTDLCQPAACPVVKVLELTQDGANDQYRLTSSEELLFSGQLGVHCAAVLFDQVIFNLLKDKKHGVALHAGAVTAAGKTLILPGLSGSGKSNMTAWLTRNGFSYLTDELIFLTDDDYGRIIPFTRPVCIKADAVAQVKKLLKQEQLSAVLEDRYGMVVPHRLLNPDFSPETAPPALILFPKYQAGSPLEMEQLSPALVSSILMTSDVNGRNLEDHGFRQLAALARTVPAFQVTYGSFSGFSQPMEQLMGQLSSSQ